MNYSRTLKYQDSPDYNYLKGLMRSALASCSSNYAKTHLGIKRGLFRNFSLRDEWDMLETDYEESKGKNIVPDERSVGDRIVSRERMSQLKRRGVGFMKIRIFSIKHFISSGSRQK